MPEPTPTQNSADALTPLAFAIYGNPRVYALLLGSGLSRAAGILTGHGITLDLVRRVAIAQGEKDQPDWGAWYKDKFGNAPDYSELIAQLGATGHERRAILAGYIEPTEDDLQQGRKTPTRAHHAIADLVQSGMVRVLITTNFDRLLEPALREHGIEPTVGRLCICPAWRRAAHTRQVLPRQTARRLQGRANPQYRSRTLPVQPGVHDTPRPHPR